MQAIPVADCWRARPQLFQLALCVCLGAPIPELDVSGGVACGACVMTHDKYGRHPSLCMRGNRSYLLTERHDGFQRAVQRALWFARVTTCAVGTRRNYFGSANPPINKELRADLLTSRVHALL